MPKGINRGSVYDEKVVTGDEYDKVVMGDEYDLARWESMFG